METASKTKYSVKNRPKTPRTPLKGIDLEFQPSSTQNRGRKFPCGLCGKICRKQKALSRHYSLVHFKTELVGLLSEESENQCSRCGLAWREYTERSKINHIGVDHRVVARFINTNIPEKKKKHKNRDRVPKEFIPDHENEEKYKSKRRSRKNSVNSCLEESKMIPCHICGKKFQSRSELYNHYSITHYKEELRSLVDRENLQCQFCGFQRNKIDVLTVHIGSVHDKVEDFLPAEFHLPRSRSRPVKYSKISSTSHPESPVELNQTRYEQTVEESRDTGTSVKVEEEIPSTMDPDCQQEEDQKISTNYLHITETTQPTLQNQNKETGDAQENSMQALMDEDDIRNLFNSDDDDYDECN